MPTAKYTLPLAASREQLLSVAEVKEWLNISAKTVYRRIKDGTFQAIRIGRLFRIRASSVIDLMDMQDSTSTGICKDDS
jgi:excisionase family DNA binding protein